MVYSCRWKNVIRKQAKGTEEDAETGFVLTSHPLVHAHSAHQVPRRRARARALCWVPGAGRQVTHLRGSTKTGERRGGFAEGPAARLHGFNASPSTRR